MKVLVLFALFELALAETYEEFRANNAKSVADYAVQLGFSTFVNEFNKFKTEHHRNYESTEEEEKRKFNFLNRLEFIQKHNQLYKRNESTYEVGVTQFADMTNEEYLRTFTMPLPGLQDFQNFTTRYQTNVYVAVIKAYLPNRFDWRDQGIVTPIKNQKNCGSCWAFATVAMVESQYLLHRNKQLILSEQQLVDCMYTDCKGVYINVALDYVVKAGIEKNSVYPYVGQPQNCQDNPNNYHAKIFGYKMMGRAAGQSTCSDEEIMSALLSIGPLALMFDAGGYDFSSYKGGILNTGDSNGWTASHAVTLVGWGSNYSVIKNSWGTKWGENGYLRMARGRNLRHVNEYLYTPIF